MMAGNVAALGSLLIANWSYLGQFGLNRHRRLLPLTAIGLIPLYSVHDYLVSFDREAVKMLKKNMSSMD